MVARVFTGVVAKRPDHPDLKDNKLGRPVGSRNTMRAAERREAAKRHAADGGIMPLDFMLMCLRDKTISINGSRKHTVRWADRCWAAEKLLHCFTPKLTASQIDATVKVLSLPPEALKNLNDDEIVFMERILSKISGVSPRDMKPTKMIEGEIVASGKRNEYEEELG